ncbi:MAG: twin-arginine translocase TatA/TatE family subunit [Flavobacterium sp. BFFFF1]|uniref:twin-arginine translocase TatA/TatE family subunit n=1 Tax=unclassified Flavobacterium TaxID=196869 RepID=UPI000BD477F8|nr:MULTISPECIES: twin-arginine translocase TatA/TatE family subunit [unclassified Flavobacterium]OYU81344.1 MAG: twin-arginine translocase TatA/TatE family subunit [Flavobacterium sp. BFFFF1]
MNALYFFMGEITPMKVILVLAIVLLLFGGKKIPELMKGLGSGVKEFKNAAKGEDETPAPRREEEKI